ncbi:MAG: hypothetical protein COT85_03660 [Chlamydiae bacterium CG10_big_fil_rev_8_21_14_0_10_42_34]|nr:MAG: hypothetical protein COT85_03660 [Chlamydiae bacterium CG10_big_fil_rev_8_21_14_0_10_42_34]
MGHILSYLFLKLQEINQGEIKAVASLLDHSCLANLIVLSSREDIPTYKKKKLIRSMATHLLSSIPYYPI